MATVIRNMTERNNHRNKEEIGNESERFSGPGGGCMWKMPVRDGWTSDGPDRSGEVQDLRRFGGCLRSGFGVISLNLLIFLQPLDALR